MACQRPSPPMLRRTNAGSSTRIAEWCLTALHLQNGALGVRGPAGRSAQALARSTTAARWAW
eukprot:8737448-Prorocentrum_lima.AAC.1